MRAAGIVALAVFGAACGGAQGASDRPRYVAADSAFRADSATLAAIVQRDAAERRRVAGNQTSGAFAPYTGGAPAAPAAFSSTDPPPPPRSRPRRGGSSRCQQLRSRPLPAGQEGAGDACYPIWYAVPAIPGDVPWLRRTRAPLPRTAVRRGRILN